MESVRKPAEGLDGVVVAETRLSRVDGEAGRLVVCGRSVEQLAGSVPFEGMCGLLWRGEPEADDLREALGRARVRAFVALPRLGDALAARDGMDALRAAAGHLEAALPPDPPAIGPADLREHVRVTAALAVFAGAWARRRVGAPPVEPDPSLPHAADLLRLCTGRRSDPAREAALDAYLVTIAEHGMNASTFTARVVASTGSDAVSAVVAALGALKGPRHGGAPGPVLDTLDAIGRPERARACLEAQLAAGRRIMGMGHRVYRVRDPRAAVLEATLEALERAGVRTPRLALARAVEDAARALLAERYPARRLDTNVEFYTAVLLDAMELERAVFTPVFAAARVAGWLAHVDEQRRAGRIIRPLARYVGPLPAAA